MAPGHTKVAKNLRLPQRAQRGGTGRRVPDVRVVRSEVADGAACRGDKGPPAANPFGPDSPTLDAVGLPPLLVATGDRDMLVDRIRDYVARLKAMGKRVELVEFAGQGHAFAIFQQETDDAGELVRVVRQFVHGGAPAPAPAPASSA
ncbi:hypothetical protein EJB05_15025, partial [Eragrostis curvula]